ncbi:MAG: hypothetical protein PHC49_10645 [Desulfuromonadaceae bacterium]|nr:hypothetical protein [Desulfuromonadaceae bacterium]
MKLTIFVRELVTPKFYIVQVSDDDMGGTDGPTHPEHRQTPIPAPNYPSTFIRRVYYAREMDYYGSYDNPYKRAELWEDSEGIATWPEILAAFPELIHCANGQIREVYSRQLAHIASPYYPTERETWHVQQREAETYLADNTAAVPMLTALASARGITVAALVDKIMGNVNLFRTVSGQILGQQQAKLDSVANLTCFEDIVALLLELDAMQAGLGIHNSVNFLKPEWNEVKP